MSKLLKSCFLLLDLHRRWTLVAPSRGFQTCQLLWKSGCNTMKFLIIQDIGGHCSGHSDWDSPLVVLRPAEGCSTSAVCKTPVTHLPGRAEPGAGWSRQGWAVIFHHYHCPGSTAALAGSCSVGGFILEESNRISWKEKVTLIPLSHCWIILTTLDTKSKSSIKL